MTDYLMSGERARWQVIWVVVKKGKKKLFWKEFDTDLNSAVALYCKAKAAGKPLVTLRCANVAFPPPDKYLPTKVKVKVRLKKPVEGKKFRIKYRTKHLLAELNERGICWCPYCREFRRFDRQAGYRFEGIYVEEPGWHCPICQISHRNHHVRKYNPSMRVSLARRTRRSGGSRSKRSRQR